jgi:short-subunit dehydrogenase
LKILITGASSGLGEEFARQYVSSEVELILLARREDKLLKLQLELQAKCKNIQIIVADVTDFDLLQEKIKLLDSVDMVILNAGISLGHTESIPTIAQMQNLYNVNLLSNHAILEILLPKFMAQKSGKIVFISSLASLFSMPSAKIYSSSKRALNAYAEGLRYKYAPHGIEVITLLPGFIKSELTDKNNFHMPWLLETKDGVALMRKAIEKRKNFYAFPFQFYVSIQLLNLLPQIVRQKFVSFFRS